MNNMELTEEIKAWIKRNNGPDEVIRVMPDTENSGGITAYLLYMAHEKSPDCLGRILFDREGYWIYDGEVFTIAEQEQLAKFIISHVKSV